MFNKVTFIGIGLIGSSLARAMRAKGLASHLTAFSREKKTGEETCKEALKLGVVDSATTDMATALKEADLVVIATPLSAYQDVAETIATQATKLAKGCIVTDVGSVKQSIMEQVCGVLPSHVAFVPAHPIAGTENSGPAAGFATLFENRWCILTPEDRNTAAVATIESLWEAVGSKVSFMDAAHHDRVLSITSHIPHLIAYSIVDTVVNMEESTQSEVIQYSGSGFRDFTRIAASDPVMWRDIFLHNREAVLEMLEWFRKDLSRLESAIRNGDGEALKTLFSKTRTVRREVIEANKNVD